MVSSILITVGIVTGQAAPPVPPVPAVKAVVTVTAASACPSGTCPAARSAGVAGVPRSLVMFVDKHRPRLIGRVAKRLGITCP